MLSGRPTRERYDQVHDNMYVIASFRAPVKRQMCGQDGFSPPPQPTPVHPLAAQHRHVSRAWPSWLRYVHHLGTLHQCARDALHRQEREIKAERTQQMSRLVRKARVSEYAIERARKAGATQGEERSAEARRYHQQAYESHAPLLHSETFPRLLAGTGRDEQDKHTELPLLSNLFKPASSACSGGFRLPLPARLPGIRQSALQEQIFKPSCLA